MSAPATAATRPTGRLSVNAYVVLGLLRLGSRSGYEIKRAADASTRFFWVLSPPQIYTELARLEQAGLLEGRSEPQGQRRRRLFELTAAGEAALVGWLREREPLSLEIRDMGLLKLFFADALELEDVIEHVGAMRSRSEQALERFRREIVPLAEQAAAAGTGYPLVTARFGQELHEWIISRSRSLEGELSAARTDRDRPETR
jgi:DNA-binding PadR family transcriptional regulator